jgi:acetoacetyl-CoA reductase
MTDTRKIAYVTGGMGGIGTTISQRLCRAGFKVIAGCGPGSPRKDRWLASDESGFATGADFSLNGGLHMS